MTDIGFDLFGLYTDFLGMVAILLSSLHLHLHSATHQCRYVDYR